MSNRYLEKVAEIYNVEPTKLDKNYGRVKSVGLHRNELMRLEETEDKNRKFSHALGHAAGGAAIFGASGALYGNIGRKLVGLHHLSKGGPERFVRFAKGSKHWTRTGGKLGAGVGALIGLKGYDTKVHEKSMRDAGFSGFHHNMDRQFKKDGLE